MKVFNFRRWICIGLFLSVSICSAGCWPAGSRYPKYDSEFLNATGSTINDVQISWSANGEDFRQRAGIVSQGPDSSKVMGFSPDPIPDKVLATWRSGNGERHEQVIDVASHIPDIKHFTGSIVYKFTANGVDIESKKE